MLVRIYQWAEKRDDVRALILTGSHAQGRADPLSDFDVEIFTRAPERYVQSDEWLTDFGTVWVVLPLHNDQGAPTRLVIFDGGVKVDFTICSLSLLAVMVEERRLPPLYERGYRPLVDKDGVARKLPAASFRSAAASPPTEEEFTCAVREFWFEVYHVAKYLTREDLWAAKHREWKTKELLLGMLEWYERSLRGWNYETENDGVSMKKWVEPEAWARLMSAYGRFDTEDTWKALHATLGLFRDIAQHTATRLSYSYPQDLDERLSKYLESLRRSRPTEIEDRVHPLGHDLET